MLPGYFHNGKRNLLLSSAYPGYTEYWEWVLGKFRLLGVAAYSGLSGFLGYSEYSNYSEYLEYSEYSESLQYSG